MAIGTTAALLGLGIGGAAASVAGARNAANASQQAGQIQSQAGQAAAAQSLEAGNRAAEDARFSADRAGRGMSEATTAANTELTSALEAIIAANGPYSAAGQQALQQLQTLYGDGGAYAQGFDPNSVNLQADPGYQFRLEQGQRGIEATAAARGSVLSSRAQREVARFNSGLASQEYGNAFNRAFTAYQDSRNARTSALQGLAGMGQQATGQTNAARAATASGIGQNYVNSATYTGNADMNASQYGGSARLAATGQAGDFLTGAAASRAAGRVGSANAWNQGIGGAINAGMGAYSIYQDRPRFDASGRRIN